MDLASAGLEQAVAKGHEQAKQWGKPKHVSLIPSEEDCLVALGIRGGETSIPPLVQAEAVACSIRGLTLDIYIYIYTS